VPSSRLVLRSGSSWLEFTSVTACDSRPCPVVLPAGVDDVPSAVDSHCSLQVAERRER